MLVLVLPLFWTACSNEGSGPVGPSSTGKVIDVVAIAGDGGLPADGSSTATIRVEVYTTENELVDEATVTLTTTLGTLGSTSLTTADGVATTTLTSASSPGTATIVASVENISATAIIEMVNISTKVT